MSEARAGELTKVEITPEMIEAGVAAYKFHASHDEMSFETPEGTVRAILTAALSHSTARVARPRDPKVSDQRA